MDEKDRSVEGNRGPRPLAESKITIKEGKTPRYAWVIWIITFLISFAAPMAQFKIVSIPLYFIYVPGVSPDGCFGLDASGFGMLMTMVSLIGIVLAFPAAFICRKLGLKQTIALSAIGVIVGGLVEILGGDNIATMMVGRFLEGTGIGLAGVSAPTLITLWFPDKTRGLALACGAAGYPCRLRLTRSSAP